MSGGAYLDYQWNFPTTGLALALQGLDALRSEMSLDAGALPGNALGEPRDATGTVVDRATTKAAWIGRPGIAAYSYTNINTRRVVDVPAKGDPSRYYMHIRSDQEAPGFDPAAYGLMPTDPAESAEVLGVWAGDAGSF